MKKPWGSLNYIQYPSKPFIRDWEHWNIEVGGLKYISLMWDWIWNFRNTRPGQGRQEAKDDENIELHDARREISQNAKLVQPSNLP